MPYASVYPLVSARAVARSYTYEVPSGAVELATSDVCTQAFRRRRAWGIQFHAEVTRAMVEAWAAEAPDELPMPASDFLAETSSRIAVWNESGRRLCGAFLDLASA